MKPNIHAALYSAFIVGMMALMACSGGSGGGVNGAPAVDSPENSPPEIGTVTGAQGPTAAPPTTGTGQIETTPAGTTLGTIGNTDQQIQGTTKAKKQDGILIKGTWKQQSSLQPPRRSWIDKIGDFFIGTAYAENLGLGVHFLDIMPGSPNSLTILTDLPKDAQGNKRIQLINTKGGSPISEWKKTILTAHSSYEAYSHLLSSPSVNYNYLAGMAYNKLNLARLVTDSYGNISKTDLHIDLAPLTLYDDPTNKFHSQLSDTAIHNTPNGVIAAFGFSLYDTVGNNCEPSIIGIYRESSTSNSWETKQIPLHAGSTSSSENQAYCAKNMSIEIDSNLNLIIFQTSYSTIDKTHYITGYKFSYDPQTGNFGNISTISDIALKDASDGFMKFVADDTGNGYILGIFMGALLTDNIIDLDVPADCSEEGAMPSYFYFMDTCFKTKEVQQKGNQLIVYQYNSQDNALTPIDTIPLLGWMGNWQNHNISATFDHGSKKMVIGVNQEDYKYPPVLARYGLKDGEITKEYLDSEGLPLGNGSSGVYLASYNDTVTVGTWPVSQFQTTCNASGFCTGGSYALGSTLYKFSPVLDPYSPPEAKTTCGNTVLEGSEECDTDSNGVTGSGCNTFCKKVPTSVPYDPLPIPSSASGSGNCVDRYTYGHICCVGTVPTFDDNTYLGQVITCDSETRYPYSTGILSNVNPNLKPTCVAPNGPIKCM